MPARQFEVRITNSGYQTLVIVMFGEGSPMARLIPSEGVRRAQLTGAVVGSLPLLLWGAMGKIVAFGATLPGPGTTLSTVLLGEAITTFTMVALLAVFLGFRTLRPLTPAIFRPL
jgi:hypothetical protein